MNAYTFSNFLIGIKPSEFYVFMILWLMQFEVCGCLHNCTQSGIMCCYQKKCETIQNHLYFTKKPQRFLQGRFTRENIFSTNVNLWLLYVLSPCHCILVSILLASNTHKAENLLQLVKQNRTKIQWIFTADTNMHVLLNVLTYWKEAKFSNIGGLSILRCMWGKIYLFHSSAEMKETWPTMPRGCNLFTHLCAEVKNTAGDGDR